MFRPLIAAVAATLAFALPAIAASPAAGPADFLSETDCFDATPDYRSWLDSVAQRLFRIIRQYRNTPLTDNRPGIQARIHEMYRASGKPYAMFHRLLLRVQTRTRRKQRRVDVDDSSIVVLKYGSAHDLHVTRQDQPVYAVLIKQPHDLLLIFLRGCKVFRLHSISRHATVAGRIQRRCARPV